MKTVDSIRCIGLLCLALCLSLNAKAAATIDLSGFGTLGYAATDNQDLQYLTAEAKDGATESGTFKLDSRLGVQLDVDLNDTFSATLQGLSRQNYSGKFTPRVEWAFLKAQFSDEVNLRLGRIGVPFFMISDFREVGYANTSLRPPEDNYIQAPLGSFDGVDLTSYFEIGDTLLSTQFLAGFRDLEGPNGSEVVIKDSYGGVFEMERGPVRARFSYIQTRLGISDPIASGGEFGQALAGGAAFVPALAEPARDFDGLRKKTVFAGLGIILDLGPWAISGEYTQRRLKNSLIPSFNAWYLTAAYRYGDFTPFATVSQLTQTSKDRVDLPQIPELEEASDALNSVYQKGDQQSIILGLRWDLYDSAALKVQVERISSKAIGENFVEREGRTPPIGADVNLFSIALDFTF